MITFKGEPATSIAPATVSFTNGERTAYIAGDFGWGKAATGTKGISLARSILMRHLTSADEAHRLATRFMWRTIKNWPSDKPWTLTSAQIDAVLTEIAGTEPLAAAEAARVEQAPTPVASEGGFGVNGERIGKIEVR